MRLIAVLCLTALVTAGCPDTGDSSGTGGLISRQEALGIAARTHWHPDQATAS